jgi:signal transduction histidine kinase/CheY-like chemotaxis protein
MDADTNLQEIIVELGAEIEDLLSFLYVCPVGVIQTGIDGRIRLINPFASESLMPVMPPPDRVNTANLFDMLENLSPGLRASVTAFRGGSGLICKGLRIFLDKSADSPRVLSLSLLKASSDCLMASLQDVSAEVQQERERIRTERERREAQIVNERLTIAAESGQIGIWDFDIVTGAVVWDDVMLKLYGVAPEEHDGSYTMWSRRLHPEDRVRAEQALWSAINDGAAYDIEFRIIWPYASIRHIRATARVTRDENGRPLRVVGVNWDVTEERRLAEDLRRQMALQAEMAEREIQARAERDAAERAARTKSEFLATMSHEIRSPLSGLLGVLEVLRGTELDPEQHRMATMIHGSATMLLMVLNDVLDFSKIEANALTIEKQPTELRGFLEGVTQQYVIAAERKGIGFSLAVDDDVPDAILVDSLRVWQILENLLSNATKFTERGMVALRVSVRHDAPAPMLSIAVTDTGVGMDAAVVARLFNPFMQADGSTTRKYGGTGLGLAIAKKLSALMGGDLTATSQPGLGSVFCLTLPLLPCNPVREAKDAEPRPVQKSTQHGHRILVVEDDPTIRWISTRQLTDLGYHVDTEEDGQAGLERFQTETYHLVLTDCHMPRMDGVALTSAIRALPDPARARVPVIGLTADVTDAQRERCMAAGMTELAIKPLGTERLSHLMDHHLNGATLAALPAAPKLRAVPFDDSIFLATFDHGDAEGAAWLGEFLLTAQGEMDALAAALSMAEDAAIDTAQVARIAHRLAGTSFSVGAMVLGEGARALEAAARDPAAGDSGGSSLPVLFATLQASLREARHAIEAFTGAPPQASN